MTTNKSLYESWYNGKNCKETIQYNSDGERDGPYVFFYENGNKREECNFVRGKLDGVLTLYYDNGKIKEEISYLNDLKHGDNIKYDINGKIIKKVRFFKGSEEYNCSIM